MPAVQGLRGLLRLANRDISAGGKAQVSGGSHSLTRLFLLDLALNRSAKQIVLVLPTSKELSEWSRYLEGILASVHNERKLRAVSLPFVTLYGNDKFVNPSVNRKKRLYALASLVDPDAVTIVLTTPQALFQSSLSPEEFLNSTYTVSKEKDIDQDFFISQIEDLGYVSSPVVSEEGQYSVRGSIFDIFPVNEDFPVRLEWTIDRVSSIRKFDPKDQKSVSILEQIKICPAYDVLTPKARLKEYSQALFNALIDSSVKSADRDGMVSQLQQGLKFTGFDMFSPLFRSRERKFSAVDYLTDSAVLVWPVTENSVWVQYEKFYQNLLHECIKDQEKGRPTLPVQEHFIDVHSAKRIIPGWIAQVEFGNPYGAPGVELIRIEGRVVVDGAPILGSHGSDIFDKWMEIFRSLTQKFESTIIVLVHHADQFERVQNLCKHRGFVLIEDQHVLESLILDRLPPGKSYVGCGDMDGHIWLEDMNVLLISEDTLFGTKPKIKRSSSQKLKNYLSSFADLKIGDLVVHVQHGIGRYLGLSSLDIAGITSDFLIIEYAGADKIYLPVDRLSLLQRYSVGGEDTSEGHYSLDRLGGGAFEKRKNRVKGAVREMAAELLKIQAKRSLSKGMAFSSADDSYLKFEAAFPYDETPDQLRAFQEVEADFLSGRPMDRLICGDVGYGKTEVAVRAAMRTVLEGYQALVLVPTTILCFQHFKTFETRLSPFGVKVGQINRFVRPAEIKTALSGLESGTLDILIGTHRLLSQDILPRRLGILIVDEEQRFGVIHKEKLKSLRAGAHVLTLTATPIPRTLHMSMVGLRDISIIATPPQDRMAVKTYIAPFDQELIKEAILVELRRGGQVFFVHNRIEDIEQMRLFIQNLVPAAEVRVGHGKMPEHKLEQVIVDFLEGRFQVLLCTTIIESGIDMPHVNTLIVSRADRFGLAQLYQLRGRVGRSNVQAYAYFLTPPVDQVSDEARKRLDVLASHQELGSGFQIASHDLELRGAGNLLGDEQSGHASEVGLELYTDLLEAAIRELRGEDSLEKVDTEIRIPVSALIPSAYIASESQRLQFYKRLFGTIDTHEIMALRQEMTDRFGPVPNECALLFKVARLKQTLSQMGVTRLSYGRNSFELRFGRVSPKQAERLLSVSKERPDLYKIAPESRLIISLVVSDRPAIEIQDRMLSKLIELIDPLLP